MKTSLTSVCLGTALGLAAALPLPAAQPGTKHWEISDPNGSLSCPPIGRDGNVIRGSIALTPGYLLTVEALGPGRVSGRSETGVYPPGSPVTLTAAPEEGCSFVGWSGDLSGQSNPLLFTMDRPLRVAAVFREGTAGFLTGAVLAGGDTSGFADGYRGEARFVRIVDLDTDAAGILYVADAGSSRIRRLTPDGVVSTLAGTGERLRRDGPAEQAAFGDLRYLSAGPDGTFYVADGEMLRRVEGSGAVATLGSLAVPTGDYDRTNCFAGDCADYTVVTADEQFAVRDVVVSATGSVWFWGDARADALVYSPGLAGMYGGRTNQVFEKAGTDWQARAKTSWHYESSRYGGNGQFGTIMVACAKGRTNDVLYCDSYYEENVGIPVGQREMRLQVATATGVVTWASWPIAWPPAPRMPAAIAWVHAEQVLMHDGAQFHTVPRGGGRVAVPSNRPPETGLAAGTDGIFYSATATQILRFTSPNVILLRLLPADPASRVVRLETTCQPGKSVRIERSVDFATWADVGIWVSWGTDVVEMPISGERAFFRAVLLP